MTTADERPKDWEENYTSPPDYTEHNKIMSDFEMKHGIWAKFDLPAYIDKSFFRSRGAELLKHHLNLSATDPVVIGQVNELERTISLLASEISELNTTIYMQRKGDEHNHTCNRLKLAEKEREEKRFRWLLAQYKNTAHFLYSAEALPTRQMRAGQEVDALGDIYLNMRAERVDYYETRRDPAKMYMRVGAAYIGTGILMHNEFHSLHCKFNSTYDTYFGMDKFYTKGQVLRLIHQKHDIKMSSECLSHTGKKSSDPTYRVKLYQGMTDDEIIQFEHGLDKGADCDSLLEYDKASKAMELKFAMLRTIERKVFSNHGFSKKDNELLRSANQELCNAVAEFSKRATVMVNSMRDNNLDHSPLPEEHINETVVHVAGVGGFTGLLLGLGIMGAIWAAVKWVF